jgi:large subunit ribosomal protein L33
MRETVHLGCEECTRRNYHTIKNKRNTTEKLALKKYCKWCKKHTVHKEMKL